ncbi:MAG: hypothetical protein H6Q69_4508 [Firmicutes bacterium]|nr:hypothetical protein [Bacillota bacterium]
MSKLTVRVPNFTKEKIIFCLHCNHQSVVDIVATHSKTFGDDDDIVWVNYEWNLYLCRVCKDITLEQISECSEDMEYDNSGNGYIEPVKTIIYPLDKTNSLPEPPKDLPEELVDDYNEARSIVHLSPRGSAALLRLVLQKLCKHLGAKGKKIDDDIAFLVSNGLPETLQKAFDIVRVIGNEAVHPGTIDLKDDHETAKKLFLLINTIVDHLITQPKNINELYSKLPQEKLSAIIQRDRKPLKS